MKITFFSTQPYDKSFFIAGNEAFGYELEFHKSALDNSNAKLVTSSEVVCIFVNDQCNAAVIKILAEQGVKLLALRCAGFNNVDINAAHEAGIKIVRVPAYSPEAVAEHSVALMLSLNRKIHKAYNRVREQNFSLNGLLGFDFHGKTVGVIGTGNIGKAFCRIMLGFGCRVMAFDLVANRTMEAIGVEYTDITSIFKVADVVSLHCPLTEGTRHLINAETLALMKDGVMLINTSRGGLIDTKAVIQGLKNGKVGSLGMDVYEQEEKLFFRDLSGDIIQDDTIQRLMSFPNVIITAHQAFFTKEALTQITSITLENIKNWSDGYFTNTI
ncbi:MAG: 2-hydroxyacid dehydrogenase [Bacteroidota bacterium]